jgi:hypothetical protein
VGPVGPNAVKAAEGFIDKNARRKAPPWSDGRVGRARQSTKMLGVGLDEKMDKREETRVAKK